MSATSNPAAGCITVWLVPDPLVFQRWLAWVNRPVEDRRALERWDTDGGAGPQP